MVTKRAWACAGISTVLIAVFLIFLKSPRIGVLNINTSIAGFWQGFAHGFLILINLVRSFFDKTIGIYEAHNTGVGYNVGFCMGLIIWFTLGKISNEKES